MEKHKEELPEIKWKKQAIQEFQKLLLEQKPWTRGELNFMLMVEMVNYLYHQSKERNG